MFILFDFRLLIFAVVHVFPTIFIHCSHSFRFYWLHVFKLLFLLQTVGFLWTSSRFCRLCFSMCLVVYSFWTSTDVENNTCDATVDLIPIVVVFCRWSAVHFRFAVSFCWIKWLWTFWFDMAMNEFQSCRMVSHIQRTQTQRLGWRVNNEQQQQKFKCACVCVMSRQAISQQIISLIVPFQSLPIFLGVCCCIRHEYYGFILIRFVPFYIDAIQMPLMPIIRSHCLLWSDQRRA